MHHIRPNRFPIKKILIRCLLFKREAEKHDVLGKSIFIGFIDFLLEFQNSQNMHLILANRFAMEGILIRCIVFKLEAEKHAVFKNRYLLIFDRYIRQTDQIDKKLVCMCE